MDTEQMASEPTDSPRSFCSRWLGVYTSPGETFRDVGRKPDFVLPLIVFIISGLVFVETMLFKIGVERIVRSQIEQSGSVGQLSGEQIDQAIQQARTIVNV